jgi:hypothetical protein
LSSQVPIWQGAARQDKGSKENKEVEMKLTVYECDCCGVREERRERPSFWTDLHSHHAAAVIKDETFCEECWHEIEASMVQLRGTRRLQRIKDAYAFHDAIHTAITHAVVRECDPVVYGSDSEELRPEGYAAKLEHPAEAFPAFKSDEHTDFTNFDPNKKD